MNLNPLSDNVVVKSLSKEETLKSGIIIPDTIEGEKPEEGEVLAVGPGKMLDNGNRGPMDVKVGDKVLFKSFKADEFKIDGEEVLIISQSDISSIIN
ncbi:co-chaperone GroES [bacterium]|jgi:chaperonin GroES|nr:co-chaperone GroES [bacterium]MBT4122196.1 co-chaperone GroES [bacterium]MBT4335231.1 co-chaperone GroES [bacterium]MBT4495787.1 co-chaperone GroES [bacterium]MBT4763815.1 co-chaperone GroES [bacterium]